MTFKHYILFLLLFCSVIAKGQNQPYVDDKLFHIGFSLGINFMDYYIQESNVAVNGETYHVRQSGLMPGFSVGFITDLRLTKHLNLRFTPALHFGEHQLTYKTASGADIQPTPTNPIPNKLSIRELPISLPLYLKWSAEREMNYRPYLIAGGGVKIDFLSMGNKSDEAIKRNNLDYFLEVGAGCDFYFPWFKLCPQLTYSIGFNNVIVPLEDRFTPEQIATQVEPAPFYTQAISRMLFRQLTLTFNFE